MFKAENLLAQIKLIMSMNFQRKQIAPAAQDGSYVKQVRKAPDKIGNGGFIH